MASSGTSDATIDLTVTDVNRADNILVLHTDADIIPADFLAAWSFSGTVLLMIDESDY